MTAVQHPSTRDLDRLRAGLLDDSPAEKSALIAHVASCPTCAASTDEIKRAAAAARAMQDDPWIEQALRARRAQALQGRASRASADTWKPSIWGPAVAAALVLAVVGLNYQGMYAPTVGDPKGPQVVARSGTASQAPDVFDDLDFYIWLSSEHEAHKGNHS